MLRSVPDKGKKVARHAPNRLCRLYLIQSNTHTCVRACVFDWLRVIAVLCSVNIFATKSFLLQLRCEM